MVLVLVADHLVLHTLSSKNLVLFVVDKATRQSSTIYQASGSENFWKICQVKWCWKKHVSPSASCCLEAKESTWQSLHQCLDKRRIQNGNDPRDNNVHLS